MLPPYLGYVLPTAFSKEARNRAAAVGADGEADPHQAS